MKYVDPSGEWLHIVVGAVVGGVGGLMTPIGGAGMTFVANLGLGTAQGAMTGGLDAALWGKT